MDDGRIGTALRSVRQRRGWRQEDLAARARVSRWHVSRVEQGHLADIRLPALRRIAAALDARLDLTVRWHGGDLDRLLNRRHSALHEAVATLLISLGWQVRPEVSFSVYGERGVVDALAWHGAQGALLVVELKTEIVDVNDLMGGVDRKRRLAKRLAAEFGWVPKTVSVWVAVADGRSNRRRLSLHSAVLRAAFPCDGRIMRAWLRDPAQPVAGLSFLPFAGPTGAMSTSSGLKRVRRRREGPGRANIRTRTDAAEPRSVASNSAGDVKLT